jgi:hypothetical protein
MEKDKNFRNFIEYPIRGMKKSKNCCGFSATGDGTDVAQPDTSVSAVVQKVTVFNYVKLGLAIVGLVVVSKYLWNKFVK